jgi:hypothetical protein
VRYSYGVVHTADLEHNRHISCVVEVEEGIYVAGELAVYRFVGYLKGTNVLKPLDGNAFTIILVFVEFNRLVDASDYQDSQDNADNCKQNLDGNLE